MTQSELREVKFGQVTLNREFWWRDAADPERALWRGLKVAKFAGLLDPEGMRVAHGFAADTVVFVEKRKRSKGAGV